MSDGGTTYTQDGDQVGRALRQLGPAVEATLAAIGHRIRVDAGADSRLRRMWGRLAVFLLHMWNGLEPTYEFLDRGIRLICAAISILTAMAEAV